MTHPEDDNSKKAPTKDNVVRCPKCGAKARKIQIAYAFGETIIGGCIGCFTPGWLFGKPVNAVGYVGQDYSLRHDIFSGIGISEINSKHSQKNNKNLYVCTNEKCSYEFEV